jgi:hypothetical protein
VYNQVSDFLASAIDRTISFFLIELIEVYLCSPPIHGKFRLLRWSESHEFSIRLLIIFLAVQSGRYCRIESVSFFFSGMIELRMYCRIESVCQAPPIPSYPQQAKSVQLSVFDSVLWCAVLELVTPN